MELHRFQNSFETGPLSRIFGLRCGVGVSLTDGEVTGVVVAVVAGAEVLDVFVPEEVGLGSNVEFTRISSSSDSDSTAAYIAARSTSSS